jgi:glycogen synthase
MTHLIVCREYPPAPYPPGGIGTYVRHMARLLAEAGETVHVIAQRWAGAAAAVSESFAGRLVIHRVLPDEPVHPAPGRAGDELALVRRLGSSDCPSQLFSWQAARLAESLVESEGVDVIEAQEWEAPLFYFQVRRALGLGPRKEPPCLIHLHSPSSLIFRHNEWDETLTDFLPLTRFEDYTVNAADGLVCPSRYLARGAAELFEIAIEKVDVIPYPRGDTDVIKRAPEVWQKNTICYIGRLELRKGVVEWVDAAVRVSAYDPSVRFDFIGDDTSLSGGAGGSVREHLTRRIPRSLRPRFHFHGSQIRARVLDILAGVSVVVVPSRWENLPYACIEAMSAGIPVLASPNGGMAEIIDDGETGWIAPEATAAGFESALRRVLATPPARRADLGRAAAIAVRRVCANELVLKRHLELRARLAGAGQSRARSVSVPSHDRTDGDHAKHGVGFVITCMDRPELVSGCIETIVNQTLRSEMVIIFARNRDRPFLESAAVEAGRFSMLYTSDESPEEARVLGARALLVGAPALRSIAFLGEGVRLDPAFVNLCESVFQRHAGIGLISSGGGDLMGCDVIRVEAFFAIAGKTDAAAGGEAIMDEFTRAGWGIVTCPALLTSAGPHVRANGKRSKSDRRYSVIALAQSRSTQFALNWFLALPRREKLRWLLRAAREPQSILQRMIWPARRVIKFYWSRTRAPL